MFPLWTDAPAPSGLSFRAAEGVEVTETGTVEQLTVVNRTSMPLFLLEGELLEGGWQHRVVVHDVVLDADTLPAQVEVKCVEAHRWDGEGSHTRSGRRASPSIRAALTRSAREPTQAEVWTRVAGYGAVYGESPTASYLDYLDHQADSSTEGPPYRPLPGQRGVIVGAGGYPIFAEIFPSPDVLEAQIDALLQSVLLDAGTLAGASEPVPGRRTRRMAGRIEALSVSRAPDSNAGIADAHAGESAELVMRGTSFGDRWAHVAVFDRRHPLVRLAA